MMIVTTWALHGFFPLVPQGQNDGAFIVVCTGLKKQILRLRLAQKDAPDSAQDERLFLCAVFMRV